MDGAVPNVPDAKATGCAGALGPRALPRHRDPDPRRLALGVRLGHGPRRGRPRDLRAVCAAAPLPRDYVTNGNDSHWLSNPEQPLEGYDADHRRRAHERSLRTRLGLLHGPAAARGHRRPARATGFTLTQARPGSRSATASTPASCGATSSSLSASRARRWSGRSGPCRRQRRLPRRSPRGTCDDDLDAPGAVLFRRFVAAAARSRCRRCRPASRAATACSTTRSSTYPFDRQRPGQHSARPQHREPARVGARSPTPSPTCAAPGSRSTATLRGCQYDTRGGKPIPIHGGPGRLGVFNAISVALEPRRGATRTSPTARASSPRWASSTSGCPARALTFVTYGQSENQRSPHAADYTQGVLAQELERGPVLRAARCGARRSTWSASRAQDRSDESLASDAPAA